MDKVSIFAEALTKSTGDERRRFLDIACGNDTEMRAEIDALLAAHDDAGSFLQKTPEELIATADGSEVDAQLPSDDAWKSLLEQSDQTDCLGMLGQYEVEELIGRGGMGIVLRARDSKLNRVVAIKVLAPELAADPMSVRRFLREAQAAAAVSDDHVVTIHAIDQDARPPLIVMEYIEGKSLQKKIDEVGTLDMKSILRIGMQTASGLVAAHRQGLVHRDVKPANILLENGIERVKLTDFGLARAVDDIGMTQTGTITGTPQYMSPEQAQGQHVDHRTDLFSLGCVLYAMCTGRAAFRADSAVAVMHCIVHERPRPIQDVNEDVPDWLCEIVEKLLAKNPDDRFATAAEVENLLSQHLAHLQQPGSVPRPARLGTLLEESVSENVSVNTSPATDSNQTNQLPGWFLIKIRFWMVAVVVVIGTLVSMPSNEARFTAALTMICIGVPVGILAVILKRKEAEALKKHQLCDRYAYIVAAGMAFSLIVPLLMYPTPTAVFICAMSLLVTLGIFQSIRRDAFTALWATQEDQSNLSWKISASFQQSVGRSAIYFAVLIAIVWFLLQYLITPDRVRSSTDVRPQPTIRRNPETNADKLFANSGLRRYGTHGANVEIRDPVIDLDVTPDGRQTFVAFRGRVSPGFVRIVKINSVSAPQTILTPGICDISAAPDSRRFAWIGEDGVPHVESISKRQPGINFDAAGDDVPLCVSWSPDGSRIVAAGNKEIYCWNAKTGKLEMDALSFRSESGVAAIAWSSVSDRLAVCRVDGEVNVWDMAEDEPMPTNVSESDDGNRTLTSIDWSGDGTHLIVGTAEGHVQLMDMDGTCETISHAEGYSCDDVAFSPDSVWIVSAENPDPGGQPRVRFQINPGLDDDFKPDVESPLLITKGISASQSVSSLEITQDGRQFITGHTDGSFLLRKFSKPFAYHGLPHATTPFKQTSDSNDVEAEEPQPGRSP